MDGETDDFVAMFGSIADDIFYPLVVVCITPRHVEFRIIIRPVHKSALDIPIIGRDIFRLGQAFELLGRYRR